MDVLPQASLFLGVIPALMLLYITIKGYEGFYKDKVMFLTFVAGIIMGFIAALAQSITYAAAIVFVVLLSFFDQLFKTIILNIGRLQENRETPIYGLSLGLGFGSSFTPFMIIAISSLGISNTNVLLTAGAGSIGIILFHGATGSYIGYGIYQGKLMKHLLIAILLQLPFNFLVGLMVIFSIPEFLETQIGLALAIILYGIVVYWYTTKKVLPNLLTPSEKRKRIKKGT
jgi:hypothetical protein